MKIEKMFPVAGKKVEKAWLYPASSDPLYNRDDTLRVPAGIYRQWCLVVRADGDLYGLGFQYTNTMVHSGRNPLYEKSMYCHVLNHEECLTVVAYVSHCEDFTHEEMEKWTALCKKKEREAEEREAKRAADEERRQRHEYEQLKAKFGREK